LQIKQVTSPEVDKQKQKVWIFMTKRNVTYTAFE